MGERGINYTTTGEQDIVVCNEPCEFHGIILTTRQAGGDVTVYDGRDSTSGQKFHKFEGLNDTTLPILLKRPAHFEGGLFVDVGSHVNLVTVLWERTEKKG